MKYRIILIIIIISQGQILLSYILQTHHTHTHALPSPFRLSLLDGSLAPNCDAVNDPFRRGAGDQSWPVATSFK